MICRYIDTQAYRYIYVYIYIHTDKKVNLKLYLQKSMTLHHQSQLCPGCEHLSTVPTPLHEDLDPAARAGRFLRELLAAGNAEVKQWEDHGNHGKTMGKSWETVKNVEKLGKNHRKW